jgi:hypothetical protein
MANTFVPQPRSETKRVVPIEKFDQVLKESLKYALLTGSVKPESYFSGIFYLLDSEPDKTIPAHKLQDLHSELIQLRAHLGELEIGLINENPHIIHGRTITEPYVRKVTHFSRVVQRRNTSFLRRTYNNELQEVDARQEIAGYLDKLIKDTE